MGGRSPRASAPTGSLIAAPILADRLGSCQHWYDSSTRSIERRLLLRHRDRSVVVGMVPSLVNINIQLRQGTLTTASSAWSSGRT